MYGYGIVLVGVFLVWNYVNILIVNVFIFYIYDCGGKMNYLSMNEIKNIKLLFFKIYWLDIDFNIIVV